MYITRDSKVHGICSMERKLSNGTTSQIIINDNPIGGFNELLQLNQSGKLKELLANG